MIILSYFLISLAIGIFLVYITNPPQTVIHVYPTPDNINDIQYKDKLNNCFQYQSQQVTCPNNEDEIENYVMR